MLKKYIDFPWPVRSPDHVLIENVLEMLKIRLQRCRNTTQVYQLLHLQPESTTEDIGNSINSMPHRLSAFITAKCSFTFY